MRGQFLQTPDHGAATYSEEAHQLARLVVVIGRHTFNGGTAVEPRHSVRSILAAHNTVPNAVPNSIPPSVRHDDEIPPSSEDFGINRPTPREPSEAHELDDGDLAGYGTGLTLMCRRVHDLRHLSRPGRPALLHVVPLKLVPDSQPFKGP